MDLRTQRRLIHAAAATCVVVAGACIAWSFREVPKLLPETTSPSKRVAAVADDDRGGATTTAVPFDFTLQRPLYDPPPPPPPKPKAKPQPTPPRPKPVKRAPKLDWTLVGTIIESRRPVAILSDADGKTDIRGPGEQVELEPAGVIVKQIDSDRVTLEVSGQNVALSLQKSFDAPGGQRSNRPRRGNR